MPLGLHLDPAEVSWAHPCCCHGSRGDCRPPARIDIRRMASAARAPGGRLIPGRRRLGGRGWGDLEGACPDASGQHAARLGFLTLPCAEGGGFAVLWLQWTRSADGQRSPSACVPLLSQPVPAEPEARRQGAWVTGASASRLHPPPRGSLGTSPFPPSGSCLHCCLPAGEGG